MKKILVISPSGEVYDHDCVRWYSDLDFARAPDHYHNIGDAFVFDSSLKLLNFSQLSPLGIRSPTEADIERYNTEYDYAFLRGSNYLNAGMDWENAPSVLEKIRIPIIAFGIGAQAPSHGPLALSEATRRVLAVIADRSVSLGVRGAYTADVLWSLGIRNVRIVGCPTAFRNNDPNLRIDLPPIESVRDVAYTLRREVDVSYAKDLATYLDLQRDTILELAGRFKLDILAQGEVEEKNVLWGNPEQRARAIVALRASQWLRGEDDPLEQLYATNLFYADSVAEFERKVSSKQLVLGYRLHGNLLALANRVPAIYFTYDSRTTEFAETLRLPCFDVFSGRGFRLEDFWDQSLFERFNRAYFNCYREMRRFLDENNIDHRMLDDVAAADTGRTAAAGGMSASLAETRAVAGYVEAVTATAMLGWAWLPGESGKLSVELHLGGEIVSRAVADMPREDLAQGGIGDGKHAFSLPVPESARDRLAQLRVIARGPDGTATPLGSPPLEEGIAERLARLTKGMEMVITSQRVLHRNVQAALLDAPARTAPEPVEPGVLEAISASQTALREDIATLELFVTRLEQSLSGVTLPSPRTGYPYWAMAGTAVIAAAALGMSIWAIVSSVTG